MQRQESIYIHRDSLYYKPCPNLYNIHIVSDIPLLTSRYYNTQRHLPLCILSTQNINVQQQDLLIFPRLQDTITLIGSSLCTHLNQSLYPCRYYHYTLTASNMCPEMYLPPVAEVLISFCKRKLISVKYLKIFSVVLGGGRHEATSTIAPFQKLYADLTLRAK